MSYVIRNLLHTSLTIEDAGVTLQARGTQVISDRLHESSRMIKEYSTKKWVHVSFQQDPKPMPIWPFSKPKPISVPTPNPSTDEVTVLKGAVNQLEGRIAELIQAIRSSGPTSPVYLASTPKTIAAPPVMETIDEPMFIPTKIVPDAADVRINVDQSESDNTNFDSNLDALKSMRRRK